MEELMLLALILFFGGSWILSRIYNVRQAIKVKKYHKDFKGVLLEDIFIHDGEVYVRYLDYKQYRQFKKRLRCHKRLAKSTAKLKGVVSDETI